VAAGIDHLAVLARDGVAVDPGRVTAVGHSAGGHLALWAAARPGLPAGVPGASPRVRLRGVVAQAAVSDVAGADRLGLSGGAAAGLLGGSAAAEAGRYALASPVERLPLGVPLLLVHGGRDDVVPAAMSRDFTARAREAGDEVELVELARDGHFEHVDERSEAWRTAAAWLEART
jgi:acetyl esterase/lipase